MKSFGLCEVTDIPTNMTPHPVSLLSRVCSVSGAVAPVKLWHLVQSSAMFITLNMEPSRGVARRDYRL